MVLPSTSRPTIITSSGHQRTQVIAIVSFCFWLIFRLLFASTYASFEAVVDVNNNPLETTFVKQETSSSSGGSNVAAATSLSALELEEVIAQSAPDLISVNTHNSNQVPNTVVIAATTKTTDASQQQPQQQQQQQRQYSKQTSGTITGTIQHGATLEHPSLRNKMRRYREANREEELPPQAAVAVVADILPRKFQEYINGIKYVEVESGREGVKRYAAVIQSKLSSKSSTNNEENNVNNNNYEPVTIRAWMTIVYSGTPIGNQAASELSHIIASSPFDSVLFEVPGCNWRNSAMKPFEFVLVNEPRLKTFAEGNPDRHAFEEHFMMSSQQQSSCTSISGDTNDKNNNNNGERSSSSSVPKVVCAFPNLGKDGTLISPLPQPGINDSTYSHLVSFLRNAPPEQISQFWKLSAKTYIDELKHKHERINEYVGTWFSTNGMGVAWLHLRIDSFPKYYSYEPFTKPGDDN